MKFYQWKLIKGCDARGDGESVYMIRRTLFGFINLHTFLRSDADEHHDHPWPFVSVILWNGYVEETARQECLVCKKLYTTIEEHQGIQCPYVVRRKRKYPGMVLFRRAEHRHRVVLVDGHKAVTLMIHGPRVRDWGFYTKQGWVFWKQYFKDKMCK